MPDIDVLSRALEAAIREAGLQDVKVVRSDNETGPEPEDLQWHCGKPSSESEGHFFLGASQETWEEIGGIPESVLGGYIEQALTGRDAKQLVATISSSEAPPPEWSRIGLEFSHSKGGPFSLFCVVSPDLESAMDDGTQPARSIQSSFPMGANASEMLSYVQVPVTVSFGGTQIKMKDLLNLSVGSVVELDQAMSDSVEIRVNECLIARGEVVAVDGQYGVRVLEMVSAKGIRA